MPIYEYVCEKCEKRTEKIMKLKDRENTVKCAHCKEGDAHLVVSVSTPHFVGSGWTKPSS